MNAFRVRLANALGTGLTVFGGFAPLVHWRVALGVAMVAVIANLVGLEQKRPDSPLRRD